MELTQVDLLGLVMDCCWWQLVSDAVKLRLLNGIGALMWIGYGPRGTLAMQ